MTSGPTSQVAERELRDTHRALRAERLRVSRRRRLLRARMDLTAAAVAVPEPLGDAVGHASPRARRRTSPWSSDWWRR